MTKPKPRPRGRARIHKGSIELSAYAGVSPTTGREQRIYEHLPLATSDREVVRRLTALVARADGIGDVRARRRRDGGEAEPRPVVRGERTVAHTLDAWWKVTGQHLGGANTSRQHLDIYLLPVLGSVALWRLRPALDEDEAERDPDLVDLSDFYGGLLASGAVGRPGRDGARTGEGGALRPATVRRIHATLHAALAHAVGKGWVSANPASGIRLPADEAEAVVPEPEEMTALLGHLIGRSLETAAVALLVGNGLRPQEVAALTWNELDLDTGRLSLAGRGVARVSSKPERWEIRSTPTDKRRRRVIHLDPGTVDVLRRYRARRDELALVCGYTVGRRGHLFSEAPDGATFLSPHSLGTSFTRGVRRARADRLDVPAGLTLYGCRHYGITHALRRGVGVAEVARRFGTSQRMIHQRYAHAVAGDDEVAAAVMGAVWALPAVEVAGNVVRLFDT